MVHGVPVARCSPRWTDPASACIFAKPGDTATQRLSGTMSPTGDHHDGVPAMPISPGRLIDHLREDVRHAFRGIRRSPGFAAAVVITLGLGIGANVAMFGVVDRLMFRPYPYLKDPSTVHRVYFQSDIRGVTRTSGGYEYTRYVDLKKWTTSFSDFAAFAFQTTAVGTGDAAREHPVGQVSATFFDF